jgi:hypothetical protein
MRRGFAGLIMASSALAILGLAGCAADPTPAATPASTPTVRAAGTPSATPTPTPTVFLGTGVSLRYSCDELVAPETIDGLDRDLAVNPRYRPAETTSAERAVAIQGTACQWSDPKTGNSLIVTAAHPDPPTLSQLTKSTASYAQRTASFGNEVAGYIVNTQAEIFTRNGYWATATSPLFSDPAKAKLIMDALQQSLPAG